MFDEPTVLELAASTTLEQATAAKTDTDKLHGDAEATLSGLQTELDIARDSLRNWQSRIHAAPPDIDAVLAKLGAGSPKVSLSAAGELYARHESEQKVVRNVVAIKERSLAAARKALEDAELNLLRIDLQRQKSAAILLARKHLDIAAMVREADPTIELPVSETLTTAIDNILELQQLIVRKESHAH